MTATLSPAPSTDPAPATPRVRRALRALRAAVARGLATDNGWCGAHGMWVYGVWYPGLVPPPAPRDRP